MSVVTRVREAISGESEERQRETDEQRSTGLYHCDPCGITYVSGKMDSCSRCDGPVESVPTEQDLGFL